LGKNPKQTHPILTKYIFGLKFVRFFSCASLFIHLRLLLLEWNFFLPHLFTLPLAQRDTMHNQPIVVKIFDTSWSPSVKPSTLNTLWGYGRSPKIPANHHIKLRAIT